MKLFKKIVKYLRNLLPKKSDQNSKEIIDSSSIDKKNTSDSNYIVFSKKAISLVFKYFKKLILFIYSLIKTMMRPMIKISKKHPVAFWVAVILHILVLGAMLYKNDTWELPQQQSSGEESIPIDTMMIDYEFVEAAVDKLRQEEKKKEEKLKDEEKRSETAKKDQKVAEQEALKAKAQKVFAEVKRKAEEAKTKEAEILAKEAEEKRKLEEAKAKETVKEAKAKETVKEAEEKRKLEEAKTKEAEEKRKLEEEKAKLAEKEKEEAQRLAEEERIKLDELEAERTAQQLAYENKQYNRLLTEEIQAEQDQERLRKIQDQLTTLTSAYKLNIAARSFWRYQGAEDDWTAEVYVIQDRDGTVVAVDVRKANVDDSSKAKAFKDSIRRAVYKASPLPGAPDEAVFDEEIIFKFRVN